MYYIWLSFITGYYYIEILHIYKAQLYVMSQRIKHSRLFLFLSCSKVTYCVNVLLSVFLE